MFAELVRSGGDQYRHDLVTCEVHVSLYGDEVLVHVPGKVGRVV